MWRLEGLEGSDSRVSVSTGDAKCWGRVDSGVTVLVGCEGKLERHCVDLNIVKMAV